MQLLDRPETTPSGAAPARWLLLIHQIPPKPSYLRVKIWRRLQRLGAVAIKNSVYVLPRSDQAQEDLEWVRREIGEGGGDASICEARFVEGLSDERIEALFNAARDADFAAIAKAASRLVKRTAGGFRDDARRAQAEAELARLRRRFEEVAAIDPFAAPQGRPLAGLLSMLAARVRREEKSEPVAGDEIALGELRGRTWVTRRGLHVDRMASAWLIRRFIDPDARFEFVSARGYVHEPGKLRFDMFDAEFTHEGDRCTFEVLLARFALGGDPALRALGEIVHDVDLRDGKFARAEVAGIEPLVSGIAMAHKEDAARLERGEALFGDLYAYLRRKEVP